ncbi:MAG: T9SS type A sorting domain-containing protein, partial [Calditrichaeota bacterium]|nr:T9SS type A sorting domain-containing protein [Calditrichota bacterium]
GCGGDCGGKTSSNEDGGYEFADVHDGYYRVVVEFEGYSTAEEIINLENGDMVLVNFQLMAGRQLGVNGPGNEMPESISLIEAYPNPFNSTATISLNLRETATVNAVLYDLSGQQVQTIHQGVLSAGQNRFSLNGSNLSVGTYIVRVDTPTQSMTQTLSLVK